MWQVLLALFILQKAAALWRMNIFVSFSFFMPKFAKKGGLKSKTLQKDTTQRKESQE